MDQENPLRRIAADKVAEEYTARELHRLSDQQLIDAVAGLLAVPKRTPTDFSFVLHAPLELLARAALLGEVDGASREAARMRIVQLGAAYVADSEPLPLLPEGAWSSLEAAATALDDACSHGDPDGAERAAVFLAPRTTPSELTRLLAASVLPRVSAAGHASIFFYLLRRVAPNSRALGAMLRPLARTLAGAPKMRVTWHEARSEQASTTEDLAAALRRTFRTGPRESGMIFPTIERAERDGFAKRVLDAATRPLTLREATQLLSRVAAWSMLKDTPEEAPYGWSHCLTLPQAVLGIADALNDPTPAVAIAATYTLGFRASLGTKALDQEWRPTMAPMAPPRLDTAKGAAESVFAAPSASLAQWRAGLATRASLHGDAHLAKYTLACFDAARADPASERLYLAAAAYLSGFWHEHDRAKSAPPEAPAATSA